MSDSAIDLKQALQIARTFNLAFNNAFMFGGEHQTTKDSSANFFAMLQQALAVVPMLTISAERGSLYLENHCIDKLVSVARIISRFSKAGIQSVSFDREADLAAVQYLFFMVGSLAEFKDAATMQQFLRNTRSAGVRLNYVVYQKVTVDETVVDKGMLSDVRLLHDLQPRQQGGGEHSLPGEGLRADLAGILAQGAGDPAQHPDIAGLPETSPPADDAYDTFISSQLQSLRRQLAKPEDDADGEVPAPAEMLEAVYRLKGQILEQARIRQATGALAEADERAIDEVHQLSYQVIVRLIREEYRNDREISVKRLAQIIRRMLPDIKELRYLLPQLKDGLFAEGMSPAEYLLLVKELSRELASDELTRVMSEASEQIGLTFNELVDGIKGAPEEAARLIVLASEIRKGGVAVDERQLSDVLSEYIERVSRSLALQSPEVARSGGGAMLRGAVSRIEQELLERLKSQKIGEDTLAAVARNLATRFSATVSSLKSDWLLNAITSNAVPDEEAVLAIIEQVVDGGQHGFRVTDEVATRLVQRGYSAEALAALVEKARQRAATVITHPLEIPTGVHGAGNTSFLLDREIKLHARYNTPFSTLLVSFEKVVDPWTTAVLEITADITRQLTNQTLKLLQELMKRDTDIIGVYADATTALPMMILPMTELAGALYIQKRLSKSICGHTFRINDILVQVTPIVSVLGYAKKLGPDRDSFLKAMLEQHCQQKGA